MEGFLMEVGLRLGLLRMSEFCIGGSPFRMEGVSEVSKYTEGGILGHTETNLASAEGVR